MSKVIPTNQRGKLMGWRNFLGGLTASGVAYLGGEYLVGLNAFGNGYASTFMLSFILTSIGISALTFVREPVSLTTRKKPSGFIERVADIPGILKSDHNYRKFFYAVGLGALGSAAIPFYILYIGDYIHLSGTALGYFSLAFLLSLTVCNLIWGKIADTKGYRLVFLLSVGLWGLSTLMLLVGSSFMVFIIAFCGLGAGFGGYQVASQNFVLEFGEPHELPMLIAISNTASYLMMAVGPLIGGVIATHFGYEKIFWLALAVKTMSVIMVWKIKDPRNRSKLIIDVE
jgi:MFS family permease